MAARDRGDERLLGDDPRLQAGDVGRGQRDEREVQARVAQPVHEDLGGRLRQRDLHAGMRRAEVAQQRRDVGPDVGRDHAHGDVAADEPLQLVDGVTDGRDGGRVAARACGSTAAPAAVGRTPPVRSSSC